LKEQERQESQLGSTGWTQECTGAGVEQSIANCERLNSWVDVFQAQTWKFESLSTTNLKTRPTPPKVTVAVRALSFVGRRSETVVESGYSFLRDGKKMKNNRWGKWSRSEDGSAHGPNFALRMLKYTRPIIFHVDCRIAT
jgi:hypothetical protein